MFAIMTFDDDDSDDGDSDEDNECKSRVQTDYHTCVPNI